jgi:outer membrane protein assembly factor BamD
MTGRVLSVFVLVVFLLTSCGEYARVVKSTNYSLKKDMAIEYYNKKKYNKALTLFEELYGLIRGGADAEDITYYFAYCHFRVGDYLLANYFFDLFVATYPRSSRFEEVFYMSGYSLYRAAPDNQLDPTSTRDAINRMQIYIDKFPQGKHVEDANRYIEELRGRLEMKAFRAANMYFDQGYYVSAVKAYEYVLREYPDTDKRPEILFQILRSNFLFARRSVRTKRFERFTEVSNNFTKFAPVLQGTPWYARAKTLEEDASRRAEQFKDLSSN